MNFRYLTCLGVMLIATSCAREESSPPTTPPPVPQQPATAQELIVGSWTSPGGDMTFFADGRAEATPAETFDGQRVTLPGQWQLDDDKQLQLTLTLRGQTITNTATVAFPNADSLDLTDDKGVVDHMSRVAMTESSAAAGADSTDLIGRYGGERCIYDQLEFKEGGQLYVKVWGMEFPTTYQVDGQRVAFTDGQGRGIVFTRRGPDLDGGAAGICTRL